MRMKPWRETYPGACSSRQTVGGRVLRRAVREGRPRFLWGGSSPVWCRYSHATYTKGVTSLFSSSCSPDQQRALLEPWERKGGVGRCLRTSAAPALAPSFHSADCSVLHLCASAAAHAAPPSRLTHRQFGQSSSSGRVCNQSGGRWCNKSNRKTSQVDLAAAICCSCYCCDNCSRAERYCRQKPVQGDCGG